MFLDGACEGMIPSILQFLTAFVLHKWKLKGLGVASPFSAAQLERCMHCMALCLMTALEY